MYRRYALLLATALLLLLPEAGARVVRQYGERDGLPSNRTFDVAQDAKGYIWICTRNSLVRFDGREFTDYAMPMGDEDSRFDNICPSGQNGIWVASTQGLLLWDDAAGHFVRFSDIAANSFIPNQVYSMAYDSRGVLWISSKSGLCSWDADEGKCVRWYGGECRAVAVASESHEVWFSSGSELLCLKNGAVEHRAEISDGLHKLSGTVITSLHLSSDGRIWIGTWSGELYWYDPWRSCLVTVLSDKWPDGLKKSRIHDIFDYSAGELLLATDSGLLSCDRFSGVCSLWDRNSAGDSYYRVMRDREGGIWFSTYFGGIKYISPRSQGIELYKDENRPGSLCGNAVSAFCEDPSGNMWIATENGGLNYLDVQKGVFTDYSTRSHNNLHALLLDGSDLWIGTFSQGLHRMNVKTGQVRVYRHSDADENSLCNDHVYTICKSRTGEILIGTLHGFCVYNAETNRFGTDPKLRSMFCSDIEEDHEGRRWVATKGSGIWMWSADSGRWTNFSLLKGGLSLPSNGINDVYVNDSGTVYVATDNAGILRYDSGNGNWIQFFTDEGLPEASCNAILEDSAGNLWISTDSGLVRYNPATHIVAFYDRNDGIQGNQFIMASAYKSSDGRMWFGGVNGFNRFLPSAILTNIGSPEVTVSSVESRGATLKLEYAALSYASPSHISYEWRLNGFQDEWDSTKDRSVSFYNLPAGRYSFEVRAKGADGIWGPSTVVKSLKVEGNPLLSWWAVAVYVLLAASSVWTVVSIRRRRLIEKRRIEQEQAIAREKMDFFNSIAHEIKTPLTLMKVPLEQVMSSESLPPELKTNLSLVYRNTRRLSELVNQLLDFRKIGREGYVLKYEDMEMRTAVTDILSRFSPPEGSPVKISSTLPDSALHCMLDREAFVKILSNLMLNALKYAKGEVTVSLYVEGPSIVLVVCDDGPGVPQELLTEVFKPFYQVSGGRGNGIGLGLSLVKLLVEKHGGEVIMRNSINGGCLVEVRLPYLPATPGTEVAEAAVSDGLQKMLVVEDNPDMLSLLGGLFSSEFRVLTAVDGSSALDILEHEQVDIVLSDLAMPGMDGFELLRRIRADEVIRNLPVVILSAKDNIQTRISSLEQGADAYVDKPFNAQQLSAVVNGILASRRRMAEQFSRNPEKPMDGIKSLDAEWLEIVDGIIRRNMSDEDFGADMLADQLFMSRSTLQRRIKTLCGLGSAEYIKIFRLRAAAQMLRSKSARVGEVAWEVGFRDQSYFTKCFTAQFGVGPKEFQKCSNQN